MKKERRLAKSDRECIQLAGRKNSAHRQSMQKFLIHFFYTGRRGEGTDNEKNLISLEALALSSINYTLKDLLIRAHKYSTYSRTFSTLFHFLKDDALILPALNYFRVSGCSLQTH